MPDTDGFDMVVAFADRAGVLYRDKLAAKFEAIDLPQVAAGTSALAAYDFNNDGGTDLAAAGAGGTVVLLNHASVSAAHPQFKEAAKLPASMAAWRWTWRIAAWPIWPRGLVFRNLGRGPVRRCEGRGAGERGVRGVAPISTATDAPTSRW